jgi:hypothetical protein
MTKISFLACLEVPQKFVWVVGGGWWVVVVESKSSDRLWQSFILALAKPNNIFNRFMLCQPVYYALGWFCIAFFLY